MVQLRILLTNKLMLRVNSCIIAIGLWHFLGMVQPIEITLMFPIAFYGEGITAHELDYSPTVCVRLKGYKRDLYMLNANNVAIHIDQGILREGKNLIEINSENLFLPSGVKMVSLNPSVLVVMVKYVE